MTVKELIEELGNFPKNTKVGYLNFQSGDFYNVEELSYKIVYENEEDGYFSPSDGKGDTTIVGIK